MGGESGRPPVLHGTEQRLMVCEAHRTGDVLLDVLRRRKEGDLEVTGDAREQRTSELRGVEDYGSYCTLVLDHTISWLLPLPSFKRRRRPAHACSRRQRYGPSMASGHRQFPACAPAACPSRKPLHIGLNTKKMANYLCTLNSSIRVEFFLFFLPL